MAMATALAPISSFQNHPSTGTVSGPRNAIEQHRSRGSGGAILVHGRPSLDFSSCRAPLSDSAAAASSSGRDGGRDGGASCSCSSDVAMATTPPMSILRSKWSGNGSFHRNAAAAKDRRLGWSACSGGLTRLDLSRFSAASNAGQRTKNSPLRIAAEKPDLTNFAGTLLRLGKQGLEAGTKFVPESVPRPVAQAGVGLAGVFVLSFFLRSLFSTLTFILAIGALSYAAYFFLTKGESSSGKGGDGSNGKPKSTDEALEEARKIMDKYK
ncbi:unnamed protein product [Calypogeia fissa]